MSGTLNTKDIADLLYDKEIINLNKTITEQILNEFVNLVSERLVAGDKVKLNRLGTFEVKKRAGHRCIDPRDNITEIYVEPTLVVKFKSSFTIKNKIKEL